MKTILLTAAVLLGLAQSVRAYSLGGPIGNGGDSWQVATIGYGLGGDLNAPKNLGEEYRRNTPVMYYTYDQTFNDYFGAAAIASIDEAFTILNETFTNSPMGPTRGLDGYSADLVEFPIETRHINYEAKALGIVDFKSLTLALMTEQLGLTDPVRYAWDLHDRALPPGGTCPADEEYLVVQRNFDIINSPLNQVQYSPYVNDVLYTYTIEEFCTGPNPLAVTVPAPVDPLADTYSAVAAFRSGSVFWGDFYSGYTRDDVAGLRYLMQTNNVNYESVPPNSLLYDIDTNTTTPEVFPPYIVGGTNFVGPNGYYVFTGNGTNGYGYGDLAAFLAFIKTNNPAAVEAAYPGVEITSVSNSYTIVSNETITAYFTNYIGSPYGSPPVLVLKTNLSPVFEFLYYYTFGNIVTNHYYNGFGTLISSTVSTPIGAPYGSPGVTNSTVTKISTGVSGDFFVLPPFYTNFCPIDILSQSSSIKTVLAYTNGLELLLTNSAASNLVSEVYEVTYFTNYSYVIYPVTCTTIAGDSEYFQGIEKIQFIKVPIGNYNTVLGAFTTPVTNNYTLIAQVYTNGQTVLEQRRFQRILTVPDILFSAQDLAVGPATWPPTVNIAARNVAFDTANVLPGLAGPGTIGTLTNADIVWNKSGPVYYNTPSSGMNGTPYFTETPGGDMADQFYALYFLLGSFDGSTNDPTVFPNGTSIVDLENQVLVSISPTSVPNGALGVPYPNIRFSASGGSVQPPFTWSATGLPDGLSLFTSGVLSGTPQQTGTFFFTITLTDVNGLSVQWYYTLIIQ